MMTPEDVPDEGMDRIKEAYLRNFDGIRKSKMFVSIFGNSMETNSLVCLQLGIAIMLNKPIVVMARHIEDVPEGLRRIAILVDEVDRTKPTLAIMQKIQDVMRRANEIVDKNEPTTEEESH